MEEPARQNDLCNFRDCCRRRVLPAHGLHAMTPRPFQLIRIDCDALGTVLDFPEDAPGSPKIKCHFCAAPRGTLADLRAL
jgi:hypothetical protein